MNWYFCILIRNELQKELAEMEYVEVETASNLLSQV